MMVSSGAGVGAGARASQPAPSTALSSRAAMAATARGVRRAVAGCGLAAGGGGRRRCCRLLLGSVSPVSKKIAASAPSGVLVAPAGAKTKSVLSTGLLVSAWATGCGNTGATGGKLSGRLGAASTGATELGMAIVASNDMGAETGAGAGIDTGTDTGARGRWRALSWPSSASVKSTVGVTWPGPGWSVGSTQMSPSSARKSNTSSAGGGETMPMVCKNASMLCGRSCGCSDSDWAMAATKAGE